MFLDEMPMKNLNENISILNTGMGMELSSRHCHQKKKKRGAYRVEMLE
jgi:hypothetical protein